MKVRKAVITAAGPYQRTLPLQILIDRDGVEKPILRIVLEEVLSANIEQACVVIAPGDEALYAQAAGELAPRVSFVEQLEPRGYGHAIFCARQFTANEPFLHLVGDHVYLSTAENGCARRLVALAERERCTVSSSSYRSSSSAHSGTPEWAVVCPRISSPCEPKTSKPLRSSNPRRASRGSRSGSPC